MPPTFPNTLLILGTDLAGKDHFANVVSDAAADAGLRVERRRGWLCARPDRQRTSEGKSWFRLGLERLFLPPCRSTAGCCPRSPACSCSLMCACSGGRPGA